MPAPKTPQSIVIRWRRYGANGGCWRADLPPGNGLDSGFVESQSRDTVERFAQVIADRYGWPIVREERDPNPQHIGGNAEDCPACDLIPADQFDYPWLCPATKDRR